MNSKRKKSLLTGLTFFIFAVLLISVLLLTGCVRGMSPVGWSGVTAGDGKIFAGTKEGYVVSIDLSNNAIKHSDQLKIQSSGSACAMGSGGGSSACGGAAPVVAIYGSPARSVVPVFGELIYIAGYNGKVFAYDAATMDARWVYPVDGFLSPIVSAITVADDYIYFGCTDKNVYALDKATGIKKWQFATEGEIWSTPIYDNGMIFVGSFDKFIYALDAVTGEEKWKFATQANNVATPISADGILYFGSLDRNIYAIDENNGEQIWKFEGQNWFWARPVISQGKVYAPCLDNRVYVLEAKTGNKVTEYNLEGQISSWPVVIGNSVVVATNNGKLFKLDSSDTNVSPLLVSTIPENVTAPLGAVGDVVYINGPDNNLYAYNIANGASFSPLSLKKLQ